MSLSVGAINKGFHTAQVNSLKSNNNENNSVKNSQEAVSFGQKKHNAMKYILIGGMAFPVATTTLTSCDKDWLNHAEAYAYAYAEGNDSCKCHPYVINDKDTLWLHDSIPQIVTVHDTVEVKDKYHSPVIDTLNVIIDDLGGDPDRKYIPLRVSFIDEMDTKYRRFKFDGRSSAVDKVFYDATKSPWDDSQFKFIVDSPLDEKEKYMLSLTDDGKLYAMKFIPKAGVINPKGMDDYMFASESFVFDRDRANKLIRKFNVARDQAGREYAGTMEKDAKPHAIMITNPYDAKWRWTNIDIKSADAPDIDE